MDIPFETLLKLENSVGLKTFSQVHLPNGNVSTKAVTNHKILHSSEDHPEEFSSKFINKSRKYSRGTNKTSGLAIDPRFDGRTGKFKEHHFKKNFQFAYDLRDAELKELKDSKAKPDDRKKAEFLLQRHENQKREHLKKIQQKAFVHDRKYFPSKKERLAEGLVDKFRELKQTGRVEKHLEKRRKKQAGKERKKMNIAKS